MIRGPVLKELSMDNPLLEDKLLPMIGITEVLITIVVNLWMEFVEFVVNLLIKMLFVR